MSGIRVGKDAGPNLVEVDRATVMDVGRGVHRDPAVTMAGVVPGEEVRAEGPRILDRAEPLGKAGPVLERLELGLRGRPAMPSRRRDPTWPRPEAPRQGLKSIKRIPDEPWATASMPGQISSRIAILRVANSSSLIVPEERSRASVASRASAPSLVDDGRSGRLPPVSASGGDPAPIAG